MSATPSSSAQYGQDYTQSASSMWHHHQAHYAHNNAHYNNASVSSSRVASSSDLLNTLNYETSEDISYFFSHEDHQHLNNNNMSSSFLPFSGGWEDYEDYNNQFQDNFYAENEQNQCNSRDNEKEQARQEEDIPNAFINLLNCDHTQLQKDCAPYSEQAKTTQLDYEQIFNTHHHHIHQVPIEHAFEQLLGQTQSTLPAVHNYYKIFHEGSQSSSDNANCASLSSNRYPSPISQAISPQQLVESNPAQMTQNTIKPTRKPSYQPLEDCRKKNVVKNIMNALKKFIMSPIEHGYSSETVEKVLSVYNEHAKSNKAETLENMQMKFKRYLAHKKFNHYSLGLLMHHPVYVHVLRFFLDGPVEHWAAHSRVTDLNSHWIIIEFLKQCFDDLSLLDLLEKKKQHHNSGSNSSNN